MFMERKPFTLRLSADLYEALSSLSEAVHRSMNDLITEAVSKFVVVESKIAARDLEATAARLKIYGETDPGFERAIEEFAEAEAKNADPLEGEAFAVGGPVRRQVQALLTDG